MARSAGYGDADAFALIFRRYETDLYRFCLGILGEPQDAQDALQNTMLRVLRALPGERREIQLRPWLYRIAHNEAVELRRRQRPTEPLEAEIADLAASVEDGAERSQRLQLLFHDMADLPERQRAALVMRELNGLEFGEIGAALGTSPSAVRQALYEARRGLQQMELGRHLECDTVTRVLSDENGRLRGRRDVRAHLRQCPDCRRFRREINDRKQALAAISPLPAFIAAGLTKSALAGSGAGAGGTSVAAGVAGGAAAGSGLIKSVAGVLAVLAIGTAAADRGGLVDLGGGRPAAIERDAGSSVSARSRAHAGASARGAAQAPARDDVAAARPSGQPDAQTTSDGMADRHTRSEQSTKLGQSSAKPDAAAPARPEPASTTVAPLTGPVASTRPEQPAPAESGPRETGAGKPENGQSSEDETEKAEARTEKQEAKAEEQVEKKQSKAEERSETKQAKAAEKTQSKAAGKPAKGPKPGPSAATESSPQPGAASQQSHPEHPSHPAQAQEETPSPAPESEPAAAEPTAAPLEASPGNGKGNAFGSENGNGPAKKDAPAPSE